MDRYAVVGNPVAHSLSPRIHAAFARATGEALSYETLLAPPDGFRATVEAFFAAGGAGLNVTVPFKAEAAAWVTALSPAAARAGAVNTIVAQGSRPGSAPADYLGCNTDGAGLVRDLRVNCAETLAGARVLMLGAGGAARGAVGPLLDEQPAALTVANRTAGRAEALAHDFADHSPAGVLTACPIGRLRGPFDVIVNATSAGLSGESGIDPRGAIAGGALCYDMVYRLDGPTAFCRWAAAHGARRSVDGLGMLVEQAALAFELWRGVAPATRPVLELLRPGGV